MNWPIVVLAYLSMFIFGLSDNIRGPLYPEILRAFSVSHSEGSLFFSVGSFIAFFGAYGAPWLMARIGKIGALRTGLVLVAVSYFGFAYVSSFGALIAFSALFGVAIGLLGVVQNLLVLFGASADYRSRAQSGLHTFYGISSLLAPLLVLAVAASGLRWQLGFAVPGALALLLLLSSFFFPALHGDERRTPDAAAPALRRAPLGTSRERVYWAVVLAIYVALEIQMGSRLAVFLREGHGFDVAGSSFWLMAFFGGLVLGRLFFATVHWRLAYHRQMLGLAGFAAVTFGLGLWVRPELMALVGFAISGLYPLWMASCEPLFGASTEKVVALGISLTGFSVVGMHQLVGFFSDQAGLTAGMSVGLFLIFTLFAMIALFPVLFRRRLP